MFGIPELKEQAARFIEAFLDIRVAPQGCIPTVGSMQGSFTLFQLCAQLDPAKDTILFIDPGFPVQRSQTKILGIRSESFDIYDFRGDRLGPELERRLATGRIAAVVYSNPNNPAWVCLTEQELQTIGRLATRYDTIVIEDLAYLCMDFRKPLGRPFEAPYQALGGPLYGQLHPDDLRFEDLQLRRAAHRRGGDLRHALPPRIPRAARPLRHRAAGRRLRAGLPLRRIVGNEPLGAARPRGDVPRAAADGALDFVGETAEYARRARLTKELFVRHGFRIVYDRDGDEAVSDGFFYTVGYGTLTSAELLRELLLYGICAISLTSTGSRQEGIRVCVSQLNRPEQFEALDARLAAFAEAHR